MPRLYDLMIQSEPCLEGRQVRDVQRRLAFQTDVSAGNNGFHRIRSAFQFLRQDEAGRRPEIGQRILRNGQLLPIRTDQNGSCMQFAGSENLQRLGPRGGKIGFQLDDPSGWQRTK